MAAIIRKSWEGYNYLFEDLADPRTKDLPFVAKPWQGLILLGLYLMFVFKWGPNFMKDRPAYNLERIIMVYNAVQVVACAYLFINALTLAWLRDYRWICEPVDFSNNEKAIKITRFVYYYFLLKVLDLLDTVFFILRKKINQVSFLHVYHHTGMVLLIWGAITYFPGGHGTLVGVINSFVHVVMYSYYLITVWDPSLKGNLWWKKYITQLQIIQFLWLVVHMGVIVFKTDCEYPRWSAAIFLPQNLFMLILFIDFYIKEYIKKPKELKKKAEELKVTGTNGQEKKQESVPNGKSHQH